MLSVTPSVSPKDPGHQGARRVPCALEQQGRSCVDIRREDTLEEFEQRFLFPNHIGLNKCLFGIILFPAVSWKAAIGVGTLSRFHRGWMT